MDCFGGFVTFWKMQDLQVDTSAGHETFTLYHPDRLSGLAIAIGIVAFVGARGVMRAASLQAAFVGAFGTPFLLIALLAGLMVCWRWSRHDVIRVCDRQIVFERWLGTIRLDQVIEIDRQRLTDVVIREATAVAKGHTYRRRSLIFLEGTVELGTTRLLSAETARRLTEASPGWPSSG